jgi:hypothetical protein
VLLPAAAARIGLLGLLLPVVACAVAGAPAGGRTVVPFGAGWRFHFGEAPDATPARPSTMGDFVRRDNVSCSGLQWNQHINMGRGGDCAISCAYEPSCEAFELSEGWPNCNHGSASRAWSCSPGGHAVVYTRTNVSTLQHNYSFAKASFQDGGWQDVTIPHDFSINQTFSEDNCIFAHDGGIDGYKAYLPRNASWYRKSFSLPQEFKGQTVYLDFEGSYQFTEVYLNGEFLMSHRSGYTGFSVRLDNATLKYGPASTNVIAVHVDPTFGSEWWYSGGGIYRPLSLVAVAPLHFVRNGVFANPQSDGTSIRVSAEIEDLSGAPATAQVHFRLTDENGIAVATNMTTVTREGSVVLTPAKVLSTWSPHTPVTYTVAVWMATDEVTVRTAVRKLEWKPRAHINGKPIMLKGFSHHNSFGGVGIVQPARLDLFQVQSARALGANFIRNAHNSYRTDLYEIMTELGVLSWDESREFAVDYAVDWADQVKQHRGHASVAIWSFCNEISCSMADIERAGPLYQNISKSFDPDRATSGNLLPDSKCNSPLIRHIDIIGTSYGSTNVFEACHRLHPNMSLLVSEDKMGDQVLRDVASVVPIARSDDGKQVELPYVMGWIGAWTLMDYFGESRTPVSASQRPWPQVSSRFGAFDIAGVPKPQAFVYRAAWVYNQSGFLSELEAPLSTVRSSDVFVRAISTTQAVASTPQVELFVNGVSAGVQNTTQGIANFESITKCRNASSCWMQGDTNDHDSPGHMGQINIVESPDFCCANCSATPGCKFFLCINQSSTVWPEACRCLLKQTSSRRVPWSVASTYGGIDAVTASNVTAVGVDRTGRRVASHQLLSGVKSVSTMSLQIDVPSKATGTGEALYMDGNDIALLRVQFLDEDGLAVGGDERNVTWSVSGPIRLAGVSSGNNANPYQQHIQGAVYETFQGLGRVLVQPTVDCTSLNRGLALQIDAKVSPTLAYADKCPTEPAMVTASAAGLRDVSIALPYSGDPVNHPLAVARANRKLNYTYMNGAEAEEHRPLAAACNVTVVGATGCAAYNFCGGVSSSANTFQLNDSYPEPYLVAPPFSKAVGPGGVCKACSAKQTGANAYQFMPGSRVCTARCISLGFPGKLLSHVPLDMAVPHKGISLTFGGGDAGRNIIHEVACKAGAPLKPVGQVTVARTDQYTVQWVGDVGCGEPSACPAEPPLATPTAAQLRWMEMEIGALVHFNMATTGGCSKNAAAFNPTKLDTDQWAEAFTAFGAREAVLVAKHGCGFATWPSNATMPDGSRYNYSVTSSAWREGKGDVVASFKASCLRVGLGIGYYYSLGANSYTKGLHLTSAQLEAIELQQMQELWSGEYGNSGNLSEIWFVSVVLHFVRTTLCTVPNWLHCLTCLCGWFCRMEASRTRQGQQSPPC